MMSKLSRQNAILVSCSLVVATLGVALTLPAVTQADESPAPETQAAAQPKGDAKTEAARQQARMLDDIYKGGIVVITQNYVNDKETIPAGTAFKQLFKAAEAKGWHQVRLLDATGDPYEAENAPRDTFEKKAVQGLLAGKSWVEEIEVRDGKRHLRVATPIPVVFEKCTMCHDNYSDVPAGQPIGAMAYTIPIDGKLVTKPEK